MIKYIALVLASLFLFIGCNYFIIKDEPVEDETAAEEETVEEESEAQPEAEEENIGEGEEVESEEEAGEPQYISFTEEKYKELLGNKPFAIFFHASWCPTCRQMEKEITQDLENEAHLLPEGTIILKADYDNEIALKQEYGVVVQSTVVVIDAEGKVNATLSAPSVSELGQEIAATL